MNTEPTTYEEPAIREARTFNSSEAAVAWLQSLPESPDSIIILTPPPK